MSSGASSDVTITLLLFRRREAGPDGLDREPVALGAKPVIVPSTTGDITD